MLLLRRATESDNSSTTAAGQRHQSKAHRIIRTHSSSSSSKISRWMWLCCAAPAISDGSSNQSLPDDSTRTPAEPSAQPTLCIKDPAPATLLTVISQQQLTLISTDTSADASRKPGVTPPSPDVRTPSLAWQIHQQQQQQQSSRRSLDAHSLAPAKSTAAVDLALGLGRAASCSLVPLTHDSLSTATALFGSFSAGQVFTRGKGPKHQDTKDSPSEIHSDLQQEAKGICSSTNTSTSSSSQQQKSTAHSSNNSPTQQPLLPDSVSMLPRLAAVQPPQPPQQQQQQQQSLLPEEQHVQALQQQCSKEADGLGALGPAAAAAAAAVAINHKHSSAISSSCQATTSSVAGWSEIILPAAAATATLDSSAHGQAVVAAAAAAAADDDVLAFPPELTAKLRKLESGLSFRMLEPDLSASFHASDSLAADSAAATEDCTTPPIRSESGTVSGAVSRHSTGVLPLGRLSPTTMGQGCIMGQVLAARSADEGLNPTPALPPMIPEHRSVSNDDGLARTSSAAVAVAFEADAAAVQVLVEAAAALLPVPRPNHGRSKSAMPFSTTTVSQLGAAAAADSMQRAAADNHDPDPAGSAVSDSPAAFRESATSGHRVSCSGASDGTCPCNGIMLAGASAGTGSQQAAAGNAVKSSLSVSSSPFAQMDLQQTVTAALLAQQQQQRPATPASPAAAAAAKAAARLAAASESGKPSSTLRNSSSSYRSMPAPYGLQSLQLQPSGVVTPPARLVGPGPLPAQNSLRPSLTSKLSWASTVSVAEPQAQVFALLNPEGDSDSLAEGQEQEMAGNDTRILRPSRSFTAESTRSFLRGSKSFTSLPGFGRDSSNSIGSSREKGGKAGSKGLLALGRVKSATALLSALKGSQVQPQPAAAAAVADAFSAAAGAGVSAVTFQDGSGGASSSSSNSGSRLTATASAPASPLRSILRRPNNTSNTSRQVQTQQQQQQQQVCADHSGGSMLAATSGTNAPLPPLPRPPSSFSLDAAAAPTPTGALSEGPFSVPQLIPGLDSVLPTATAAAAPSAGNSMLLTPAYQPGLRQTASTSSIGQVSSSGSSSGTGSSLMSLAVTRMHSAAASCGSIATAVTAAAGSAVAAQHSSSLPSVRSLDSSRQQSTPSSSRSSTEVAQAFAEAFLSALTAGNVKWASGSEVGDLLAESAKMVGLDKQLYVGKAAIIRRLNGGMDQLVKMANATATDSSSSGDADSAAAGDVVADLAKQLPKPHLSVSCPDPKGRPTQVQAVYTFKWGIRKFTMRDEFIVRGGQILRLCRVRA